MVTFLMVSSVVINRTVLPADTNVGPMDAGDGSTDRIGAWYRTYIGEPDSEIDVYAGFGLFFAGLAMGILGLGLFAIEQLLATTSATAFLVREIAFAVGSLGLPVLLFGVAVLLPVDRRATYAAGVGVAITVAAVAFFVTVYPSQWNVSGTDYSLEGVTLYATGLLTVVASTAAALVSYHVERAGPTPDGPAASATPADDQDADDPAVTAGEVQRDIDEAMADAEVTWGGVPKLETRQLEVTTPGEEELDRSTFDRVGGDTYRSETTDDAVAGLKGLRGGDTRTAQGGDVDDQTAALKRLREREVAQDEADSGILQRLRGLF